jgi:hypothetical protein
VSVHRVSLATLFGLFNISRKVVGVLIGLGWCRFLLHPRQSADAVGMTRVQALGTLCVLSASWYVVWGTVYGLVALIEGRRP